MAAPWPVLGSRHTASHLRGIQPPPSAQSAIALGGSSSRRPPALAGGRGVATTHPSLYGTPLFTKRKSLTAPWPERPDREGTRRTLGSRGSAQTWCQAQPSGPLLEKGRAGVPMAQGPARHDAARNRGNLKRRECDSSSGATTDYRHCSSDRERGAGYRCPGGLHRQATLRHDRQVGEAPSAPAYNGDPTSGKRQTAEKLGILPRYRHSDGRGVPRRAATVKAATSRFTQRVCQASGATVVATAPVRQPVVGECARQVVPAAGGTPRLRTLVTSDWPLRAVPPLRGAWTDEAGCAVCPSSRSSAPSARGRGAPRPARRVRSRDGVRPD
jgi:hypothetical protein